MNKKNVVAGVVGATILNIFFGQAVAQNSPSSNSSQSKDEAIRFIVQAYSDDNYLRTGGIADRRVAGEVGFINNGCGVVFTWSEIDQRVKKVDTVDNINDLNIYDAPASISVVNDARYIEYECKGGRLCNHFSHPDLGRERKSFVTFLSVTKNARLVGRIVDSFQVVQKECSK